MSEYQNVGEKLLQEIRDWEFSRIKERHKSLDF